MKESLQSLFAVSGFMPHGHCYLWTPGLVWLHVVCDALIVLAYYSIPIVLVYFVRKRKDLYFGWIFLCFAIFILACGTTHLMEIWNVWHAHYWLSGSIKALTAAASVPTAILLVRLMPAALALTSPSELQLANAALEEEMQTRRKADERVRDLNAQLEARVAERTADLNAANGELLRQISQRRLADERFRLVVEASPNAIVLANTHGRMVLVNSEAERLFGWDREGLLGRPVEMLVPERFRAAQPAHRGGDVPSGETASIAPSRDQFALCKDGSEVQVEIGLSPIETSEGELTLSVITDITERKKAEAGRHSAEDKFRRLVEQSLVGIYVIQDDRFAYMNPMMMELFGYTPDELASNPVVNFIAEEDRALASGNIRKRMEGAIERVRYHLRMLRKDGRVIHVEADGSRAEYNGQPAILGTLLDMTERKRAEEETRRLAAIVESSADAIIAIKLDGTITNWNAGAERIYGYSTDEMLGTLVARLIPQNRQAEEDEIIARIKRGERVEPFETLRVGKSGRQIDVSVTVSPVKDDTGQIVGASKVARDISVRKMAEAARLAAESQFQCLVEQSLVGIYVIQGDSFVYVNPKMAEIFGCSQAELTSAPVVDFVFEEDRPVVSENIRKRLAGGAESINYGTRAIRRDGSMIYIEVHGGRTEYNGRPAILGTLLDITKRRRAEEEIHQLNSELERRVIERTAQLEAANKELEAFSYSISHDLRAPLRAIDGFSEAVLQDFGGELPAKGQQYLQTIRKGAQRMGALIDDLLTFSRLSRVPLNKRTIETERLVRDALDDLAAEREGRQVELHIGELHPCLGDPAVLKQVWLNLLSNAFKYTRRREAAVVETGCMLEQGEIVYFVRDNGTGFDMRFAGKLFGVFQRLHRAADYEGTGVGLAIVQRIINRHGGRIWVEAAEDRGATFYFTLAEESTT